MIQEGVLAPKFGKRFLLDAYIVFAALFTGTIYNILDVFFNNPSDFDFVFSDFSLSLILANIALTLVIGFLIAMVGKKTIFHNIITALVTGVMIAAWIQMTFLNSSLSLLDGTMMDWSILSKDGMISVGIWIICLTASIIISLKFKKSWTRILLFVSTALLVMEGIGVATAALMATEKSYQRSGYYLDCSQQFTVAKDQNVIVLLFDTVDNTIFEQTLEAYPEYAEIYKDFTEYTNADCVYHPTFPSVAHMLTGQAFDLSSPIKSNFERLWEGNTRQAYDMMHQQDVRMNVYGISDKKLGGVDQIYGFIDNVEDDKDMVIVDQFMLWKNLISVAFYRAVPYPIKQLTWERANNISVVSSIHKDSNATSSNTVFYERLHQNHLSFNQYSKMISFHYLFGIHSPCQTDANCKFKEKAEKTETMIGCMKLMDSYLNELKRLGIYDSSSILFMADHGNGLFGRPQPFFLLKKPGETHGEMAKHNAPISYSEIFPTLLQLAGIENTGFLGKTIFDISEDSLRERTVFIRTTDERFSLVPKYQGNGNVGRRNVFYSYTYTGNRETLVDLIKNTEPTVIHMADTFD